jgi:2-amino-4-hydroxy-6-hydroxymethyldihydropteridine diphosphokinase
MGDRLANIHTALKQISHHPDFQLLNVSRIYNTEPVGDAHQNDFLNAVVELDTEMPPDRLLMALHMIESQMGRTRRRRWDPRIIDLDILTIESLIYRDAILSVPHPELAHRRFVLVPFAEIAPHHRVYGSNRTVAELLDETRDNSRVDFYAVVKQPKEV